jgi:hypothetical protein
MYWEHLSDDGVLAVHVSNRHVDLKPVVRGLAEQVGATVLDIRNDTSSFLGEESSDWLLVTRNEAFLSAPPVRAGARGFAEDAPEPFTWTDDRSTLLSVLEGL